MQVFEIEGGLNDAFSVSAYDLKTLSNVTLRAWNAKKVEVKLFRIYHLSLWNSLFHSTAKSNNVNCESISPAERGRTWCRIIL